MLNKTIKFACALIAIASTLGARAQADVISVDLSQVDPAAIATIQQAEAVWEARIQAYSTEVPRALRDQLSSLFIGAVVAPIDGVDGILGFAGPDGIVDIDTDLRPYSIAVTASMTFDLDDFPSMEADGILLSVVVHEMGHAMGFGTLFAGNDLIGPTAGVGTTNYINGRYAIDGFRRDLGNPVVSFIPLEQRGGAGTALGHWADLPPFFNQVFTPAFTKEIMTGFACDLDPDTGEVVCAPNFISNATWGAFADMGFAVQGINSQFSAPRGNGSGQWPKVTGPTVDPFNLNGVAPGPGVGFRISSFKAVTRASLGSKGSGADEVNSADTIDPYRLRNHSWNK